MITYKSSIIYFPSKKEDQCCDNYYFNSKVCSPESDGARVRLSQKSAKGGRQVFGICSGNYESNCDKSPVYAAFEKLKKYHSFYIKKEDTNVEKLLKNYFREASVDVAASTEGTVALPKVSMAVLTLDGENVTVANAGNVKVFCVKGGNVVEVSTEHTQARRMADMGIIPEQKLRAHPQRKRLTRYLGGGADAATPSTQVLRCEGDETFIMLSGAYFDFADKEGLSEAVSASPEPADIAAYIMSAYVNEDVGDFTAIVIKAYECEAAPVIGGAAAAAAAVSEDVSGDVPEDASGDVSEDASGDVSEDASGDTNEAESENIAEPEAADSFIEERENKETTEIAAEEETAAEEEETVKIFEFERTRKEIDEAEKNVEAGWSAAAVFSKPAERFGIDSLEKAKESETAEPAEAEHVIPAAVITDPIVPETAVTEPQVTEPVITEPVVTEPVFMEPVIPEPAKTEEAPAPKRNEGNVKVVFEEDNELPFENGFPVFGESIKTTENGDQGGKNASNMMFDWSEIDTATTEAAVASRSIVEVDDEPVKTVDQIEKERRLAATEALNVSIEDGEDENEDEDEPKAEKEGIKEAVKRFVGVDGNDDDDSRALWPTVIIFALSLLIVILLLFFGIKMIGKNNGEKPEKTKAPAATPTPATSEEPADNTEEPSDTTEPTETPADTTPESTESETSKPTQTAAPTPTKKPDVTPTKAPTAKPTQTPEATPAPSDSETPTETPSEETPTPGDDDPTAGPSETPGETATAEPSETPSEGTPTPGDNDPTAEPSETPEETATAEPSETPSEGTPEPGETENPPEEPSEPTAEPEPSPEENPGV